MRSSVLSMLFLLLSAPGARAQKLGLTAMDLDVEVDVAAETISGTARLTVRNLGDAPVSELPLLLNRLMRVRSASAATGEPLAFEQAVVSFVDEPKLQVDAAKIALGVPLAPGSSATTVVAWRGPLAGYVETGMLYVRDHVSREFTILREDAFAFPVVGTPSAAARRAAPRPGFTFDIRVTVPRGLVVAAGGEDEGRTSNAEKTTYRFGSRVPVPFLNVAIAAYDVTERDGVRLYAFHEDAEGARRVLERVGAAVKLLGAWLGPPASPPRFTIFEIPDGWGSQAHLVAGVMQTAAAFRDAGKLGELYHELSHLWNPPEGDAPSPRWNEGLAMFLQRRLADALDGGASVAEAEKRVASRVLEDASSSRLDAVPLADYGRQGMTDHSYSVAFLWFAVLSRAAGEERMLAALRDVFQAHMKSGLSTRELLAGLESRLGRVARDVDADWVTSVAWVAKLRAAGSVDALARTYASKAEERGP